MAKIFLYGGSFDQGIELKFTKQEKQESEKRQQEIQKLAGVINRMQQANLETIRQAAQRQGITAKNLKDLKSEHKRPFVERAGKKFSDGVKRAFISDGCVILDQAYFCPDCGWVRGIPLENRIKEIKYCKICNLS